MNKCLGPFDRGGLAGSSTTSHPLLAGAGGNAAYNAVVGGFVINNGPQGGITWSSLQASAGSPSAGDGAIGGAGAAAIDTAWQTARAYNTANAIQIANGQRLKWTLKIRVFAGIYQPTWLKNLAGTGSYGTLCNDGSGDTLLPFWTSAYRTVWSNFMVKLAAYVPAGESLALSANDLMGELAMGACMTTYAEPMLITGWTMSQLTGSTTANLQAALQNTYLDTVTAWGGASGIVPISVAHNPCAYGGVTFTNSFMDFLVNNTTQLQGVIENNSLRANVTAGTDPVPNQSPHQRVTFPLTNTDANTSTTWCDNGTFNDGHDGASGGGGYTTMYTHMAEYGQGTGAAAIGGGAYPISAPSPITIQTDAYTKGGSTTAGELNGFFWTFDYAIAIGARMVEMPFGYNAATATQIGNYTAGLLANDPTGPVGGAPGVPTGVNATGGNASAVVTWNTPSGSPTGYTVKQRTSSDGGTTWVDGTTTSATSSPKTITSLSNGTLYDFKVLATNGSGSSAYSTASNAVTPVSSATTPGTPGTPVATTGQAEGADVSWTAPLSDGGSAILSYTVTPYISATPQTPQTFAGSPAPTGGHLINLTDGTAYTCTVYASNAQGPGSASSASASFTPAAPLSQPNALQGCLTRNGAPGGTYNSSLAAYRPSVGGYVIAGGLGDHSFVAWSELQPTQAMNTAGTLTSNNVIDQAIAEVTAYNAANGTTQAVKLRIHAGWRSPVWAGGDNGSLGTGTAPIGLDGVASFAVKDPQFNDGGWCPRFWLPNFQTAYYKFEAALIRAYDASPVFLEVLPSMLMTIYNEPMLRQIANATQVTAMRAAGYVSEAVGAQRQVTDAVLNGTTTLTSATATFVSGDVGCYIVGPGIPIGTTIASRTNGTTVLLSTAAQLTLTGGTVTIMGTGSYSDQYQQLNDISMRYIGFGGSWSQPVGWATTKVAYDFNPYQVILAGSTNTDSAFGAIATQHAYAVLGLQFSWNNSSYRVSYLPPATGTYPTMYAQGSALPTTNGIQTAATIANIGNSTAGLGGGSTFATIVANGGGNAATIAGAGLYLNAGHVEMMEGFQSYLSVSDVATLTSLFPVPTGIGPPGGPGIITQVGSEWGVATSSAVASVALPSHTVTAGNDVIVECVGRTPATAVAPSQTSGTATITFHQIGTTQASYNSNIVISLWRGVVTVSGTAVITATPTGGNSGMCATAFEFNGMVPYATSTNDLFVKAASGGNSASIATGTTGTSAQGSELVMVLAANSGSASTFSAQTFTPSTGPNIGNLWNATTATCNLQGSWQLMGSATTTEAFTCTSSTTVAWCAIIATFEAATQTGGNVPGQPTGVAAASNGTSGDIVVSWTTPSNGGSALTSYTVTPYIAGVAQSPITGISSSAITYTATGLTNGTTYTFTVIAINANGSGPASAQSNGASPHSGTTTPGAPGTPVGTSGEPESADIAWTQPASNGGSTILSYTVTATPTSGTTMIQTFSGSPAPTFATLTGLQDGMSYTATVHATNAQGDSSESSASAAFVPAAVPVTVVNTSPAPPAAHPMMSSRYRALLNA